jgi:hypothetical protein
MTFLKPTVKKMAVLCVMGVGDETLDVKTALL